MKRLDAYLVGSGLTSSREKAKRLILDGKVTVNGKAVTKPSTQVEDTDSVSLAEGERYVGRGALKLVGAFEEFGTDVKGLVCADIGASTGGFTQVMLERGASRVYAVDVGHGQLADELLADSRVVNCEGVNVRFLTGDFFKEPVRFAAVDLSFISLTQTLPAVAAALAEDAELAVLIKPQFEAGRQALNKHGIVRDRRVHERVLTSMLVFFDSLELSAAGLIASPVSGGDGNIEYLAQLVKGGGGSRSFDVKRIVAQAHENTK